MKKRVISIFLVILMTVTILTGCTEDGGLQETEMPGIGKTVGLAMPTQYADRWISDFTSLKEQLAALGYMVIDRFAEDNIELQISQIEEFIELKVDCIVISSIDSAALTEVENKAKEAGIPIIAYDRLLMNTDAVSYYATFDNKGIGRTIGEMIVAEEELEDVRAAGEFRTIEFFMGSPDDNNAYMIYQGLLEVLKPYLDDGTLVCRSGNISFNDTSILRWSKDLAEERCRKYLKQYYTEEELDICASAFDKFSYGCITALEEGGYTEENWPLITGQDAEIEACKYILEGKQAFTIYKDTRLLAEKCVTMVNAVCNGMEPEINDTEQYYNNVITVPAYLCKPVVVDKENMKTLLIDSGYYTEEQLYQ